jgi:iron complex outermembrane receptor protein
LYHIEANSSFVSEDLLAYELGYRAEITPKLSTSASAFYNNYDNLRSQAATIDLTPTSLFDINFQNGLKGHTVGFELSADYQLLDWWRLHAGYDFIKEHIHVKAGDTDLENALGETADPQNQVFLRSSMDLPGRIELDTDSRWIDRVRNNNSNTPGFIPSYFELDIRVGWHVTKNLELSVVGQNLLHDHHAEAGFPNSTQEQIVRNVYGEVAFRW